MLIRFLPSESSEREETFAVLCLSQRFLPDERGGFCRQAPGQTANNEELMDCLHPTRLRCYLECWALVDLCKRSWCTTMLRATEALAFAGILFCQSRTTNILSDFFFLSFYSLSHVSHVSHVWQCQTSLCRSVSRLLRLPETLAHPPFPPTLLPGLELSQG